MARMSLMGRLALMTIAACAAFGPARAPSRPRLGTARLAESGSQQRELFVRNIPFDTTEDELAATLASACGGGVVASTRIPLDRESGRSRGFGFVKFAEGSSTAQVLRPETRVQLRGRLLKIQPSEPRARQSNAKSGGALNPRQITALLSSARSVKDLLGVYEKHASSFNAINAATCVHRIAKNN